MRERGKEKQERSIRRCGSVLGGRNRDRGRPSLGWATKKFRGLRVLEEDSLNSRQGEQGP